MKSTIIFIEAESFKNLGGWKIDQQSIDTMGSPYLLAHGFGIPVKDASTFIEVHEKGEYRVWVRTRDWVAPWNMPGAPGKFQLFFDQKSLNIIFGTEGEEWHWQNGGKIYLDRGKVEISLHDLTGFDGRCDAIILTNNLDLIPPNEADTLRKFRRDLLGLPNDPGPAWDFDLVVAGGGIAGITTAISAARSGCKVALIQDRPILGGNNSSEVRVGLSGLIFKGIFPNLGKLVDEISPVGHWTHWEAKQDPDSERSKKILEIIQNNPEKKIHNAGPASNYEDDLKLKAVEAEENIQLFLNTHIKKVIKSGENIESVIGVNIITGEEQLFRGQLFADCTGDGTLGFLAGADYRVGRESRIETDEESAPLEADNLVMGTSVQWFADKLDHPSSFPECLWAIQFKEDTCQHGTRGDWNWETGFFKDQVEDIEYIRDYGLRAVYGNWSFLKNQSQNKSKYENYKLSWVAYIGGKRESRRLLGDVILKEQDIVNNIFYPDASFATTWTIDLHYPVKINGLNEEAFLSEAKMKKIEPYAVPYRCLYSRNVGNLFMAGRNISVTHVALGTIRVMRTTGMMGEVIGLAASLCKKENIKPREVYTDYLKNFIELLKEGVTQKNK